MTIIECSQHDYIGNVSCPACMMWRTVEAESLARQAFLFPKPEPVIYPKTLSQELHDRVSKWLKKWENDIDINALYDLKDILASKVRVDGK